MKITNMFSSKNNKVPNQFIITDKDKEIFQSYNSIIAIIEYKNGEKITTLDKKYWDYSKTTGKYRNQFLGETKKETEQKIKTGVYKLDNLN